MTVATDLLTRAVGEAARLLEADGAMIYLVEEATGKLRFAHDAGIRNRKARRLIRDMSLSVGVGMFGTAVARRELLVTEDYPNDDRFVHFGPADEVVELAEMRSMVVAPLLVNDEPIGAMGAYSARTSAFTEAQVALLRALADHAAAAIGNQRLLERLASSEARYRDLVEGSPDVVWATSPAGAFTFVSETVQQLTGWQAHELIGQHWSSIVAEEDRSDFERRWREAQADGSNERRARFTVERRDGTRAVVELRGREALVEGRSGGAHGSMRDITELDQLEQRLRARTGELARQVETQATLQRIAARITAIRDRDEVLQAVVDAAVRLLGSDGAHLTLRDSKAPILHPHVMAGGMEPDTRAWLATQDFPIDGGLNGLAVRLDTAVWTTDYLVDPRIPHTADDQLVAEQMGLRGMAVAPLRAPGGAVFGTLAISYRAPREIPANDVELLQALADIGAIAIANARLNDQLAASEQQSRQQAAELERVVEVQRTLGEISRRIVEVADSSEVLQQVVDAASSLLGSDGAHLTLMNDEGTDLIPMVMAHHTEAETRAWLQTQRFPVGGGINGLAAQTGRAVWTDDYAADPRIPHDPSDDSAVRLELGAAAVAPLRGPGGEVIGTLSITYREPRSIDPSDVALLEELAGQGAIAARNARLYTELRDRSEDLGRFVDAQRALAEIAAQISTIRDPATVLRRTIDEAKRLLGADHALINQLEADRQFHDLASEELKPVIDAVPLPVGLGVAGAAIADGIVRWTGDYASDRSFKHLPAADAWMQERGFVSQMSAPLGGDAGPIAALTVYAHRANAFDASGAELLGALASHAAIVQANARLYREATEAAEELARLLEAQRSLWDIAVQITSIRDPAVLVQRTVDEAARLLDADLALINPLTGDASLLEWAVAYAPRDQPLDDVDVTPGQGVSGLAFAERRVVRTGDYLNDPAIEHTPELDDYIGRRGMHSVMSAPLDSVDAPIGTLTVQARRTHAFSEDDEQLLGALAAQAAIAITNARLYEQQRESERRYRHLVDHSPDLVWSVDAEGRFTYLGESLERITGFRPDDLIGKHWAELTEPTTAHIAAAGWQSIVDNPDKDEQIRILLPVVGGGVIPAEINMIGTVVDGRFTGAHGSIRDIRERERLEEDLRRRSAELAANEERANLARELHDSVTQALFSMGLTVRALEILLDRDPEAARGKLAELRDLQKDALAEMRNLIFELRPRGLEADGLPQALRTHAAAVEGRTGLAVSVAVDLEGRLPLDMEESLYRIAQEALHNVVKHANARSARIALKRSGRSVQLTVQDDGTGFDPAATPRGHLGLVGMHQRAEGLGGALEVERPPAGGTRVRATIPLPPEASAE